MQYCSLYHWTLLPSPVTSTVECVFALAPISSFFLELFLHWSPVAYWAPTDLGSSSFIILLFCLFMLFMGFSRQEYWSGLPFPSPVDHILSDLSTMTRPSWVALHGTAHSYIELRKAVVHVIRLVRFLWLWFSICSLMENCRVKPFLKWNHAVSILLCLLFCLIEVKFIEHKIGHFKVNNSVALKHS